MGLKCETKPNQNNTPVYCAHLDKYNGIVLAYLQPTLPIYTARRGPGITPPTCESACLPTVAAPPAAPPGATATPDGRPCSTCQDAAQAT